ncbi:MAG: hypothetical protein WKF75_11030, partial [Singulisphaera sp.]
MLGVRLVRAGDVMTIPSREGRSSRARSSPPGAIGEPVASRSTPPPRAARLDGSSLGGQDDEVTLDEASTRSGKVALRMRRRGVRPDFG